MAIDFTVAHQMIRSLFVCTAESAVAVVHLAEPEQRGSKQASVGQAPDQVTMIEFIDFVLYLFKRGQFGDHFSSAVLSVRFPLRLVRTLSLLHDLDYR